MEQYSQNLWLSITDSAKFRRFLKQGIGSRLMHNQAVQYLHLSGLNLLSGYQSKRNASLFQNIQTCCLFIGHTKSGNSMIGSLLDAHSHVILADEADTLRFLPAGFHRNQIFYLLLRASRRETQKGRVTARRLGGYSWQVPGQWQGKAAEIQVIGDSTSGTTTRRLGSYPGLYPQLQEILGNIKIKFIHMIRNPYDPISVMMVRGKRSFENAFTHYATSCEYLEGIYQNIGVENILPIRYESFIAQPETQLAALLEFLGVKGSDDYLHACSGIIKSPPQQPRQMLHWEPDWIETVQRKIEQVEFLEGYSFTSGTAGSIEVSGFSRPASTDLRKLSPTS